MKHFSIIIPICYCLLCLGVFVGCQSKTLYHNYQPTPSKWGQDTLKFQLPAHLTPGTYELYLEIRHKESYAYQDLWLAINHIQSAKPKIDTLHIYLADKKGNWLGNGKTLIQHTANKFSLKLQSGDSLLYVTHLMQDKPLTGISDIGIRLLPIP